ncbi:MAG: hypothetical protein ACKOCD_09740 [Nitrospiraceae bacterium]
MTAEQTDQAMPRRAGPPRGLADGHPDGYNTARFVRSMNPMTR